MNGVDEAAWQDAFDARTVAVDGGHLHWTGATTQSGTPVLALNSQVRTAYRAAFLWEHGREPEGNVRPDCGFRACVAGAHLRDRMLRAVVGGVA